MAEAFDAGIEMHRQRGLADMTVRVYESQTRKLRQQFGHRQLSDLQPFEIEQWVNETYDSPVTRRQVIKCASALMRGARYKEHPFQELMLPIDRRPSSGTWLRPEQVIDVLNIAYQCGQLRSFALQAFLGLSRSEALGLRWRNVARTFVRVQEANVLQASGKFGVRPSTKTTSRYRIIPMGPWMQSLLAVVGPEDEQVGRDDITPRSDPIHSYLHVQSIIKDRLGILAGHSLRHTFATLLSLTSIPDSQRKFLMGHAGEGITDRVYTHQVADRTRPYVESVERMLLLQDPLPNDIPIEWLSA